MRLPTKYNTIKTAKTTSRMIARMFQKLIRIPPLSSYNKTKRLYHSLKRECKQKKKYPEFNYTKKKLEKK